MNATAFGYQPKTRPGQDIVERDGSVRPIEDTGFRMKPQVTKPYIRQPNPPEKPLVDIETVHEDDIIEKESTGIRGINYITVDAARARARQLR